MNVLLFWPEQREVLTHQTSTVVVNNPSTLKHLNEILKLKTGDELRVGEINGLLGTGKVETLDCTRCVLTVNLHTPPPEKLPCALILALPRPQQFKRILVHVASLGIQELHLIQTDKVEKNYWQSPVLKDMQHYLIEGLEQARDTVLPNVTCHLDFKHFIEHSFQHITHNKTVWLAHPDAVQTPHTQNKGEHVVMVGPEGGFSEQEVALLIERRCVAVSLGSRILKTETAIPVLISRLFELP